NTLKYYGPEARQGTEHSDYSLPDFAFINQEEKPYTRDSLMGKVWLAAFFSPDDPHLTKITERLLDFNWRYRDEPDILIVCFCTDCENTSARVMKQYIDQSTRYNGFPGKWQFLSGNYEAMQSYLHNGFLIEDISSEAIFRLVD